ncbi:MAG: NAD-binding protein, partial [Planctomycetota bacterium]
ATGALVDLGKTLLVGSAFGAVGTYAIVLPFKRHLVPDELENAVSLAVALGVFVAADQLAHESGLLAVTLMGFLLANRKDIDVHHIIEFKENLRVLLISSLFIVLAATIDLDALRSTGWNGLLFVAALIAVVRPAAVLLSTLGTELAFRDRAFLSALAPRGIVAAAVSSLFGLRLQDAGVEGAELLAPLAFVVIIATVAVYGLGAGIVARRLGLSDPKAQGTLIAGAGPFALALGKALEKAGIDVLYVDTNRDAIARARLDGLGAHYGSILSSEVVDDLPLGGTGRFLGLTPNDEVNALAAAHFAALYGRAKVYQTAGEEGRTDDVRKDLRGRVLFDESATIGRLDVLVRRGATVKATPLTDEFDYEAYLARNPEGTLPLGTLNDGTLELFVAGGEASASSGETVLGLVPAEDTDETEQESQRPTAETPALP